jgi:hypothetical protein
MAAAVGPMLVLVNSTPDRIPADIIAEQMEADRRAAEEAVERDSISEKEHHEVVVKEV